MSSFSQGRWHKRVFRSLHDQRRNLYLGKPIKVVCAKASPFILAPAQPPKSGASARFPGDGHYLVERLFQRDLRIAGEWRTQNSAHNRSILPC